MKNIIAELEAKGFSVLQTKTLHDSGAVFYQLKKDDVIYPKSRGNKQDVGDSTIITCYKGFGINGVLNIFSVEEENQ